MSEIFISYARSTAAKAQQIAEALRGLGYTVWRDDELPAHRSYAEVIEEHLEAAKAVVVVWSADAVKSEWVQSEADRARTEHKLVQLSVDGARLPMPFDRIQCADLAGWSGDAGAPGWIKVTGSVAALVRGEAAPARAPWPTPAPQARRASICVLPFANMSDDPQQEYFSDGISEDIITDLSKVSALSVVARNTAFTFKGRSVDVTEVAARLNVSHVLEGSVRKAGGRVRITAQLIDGLAGDHVWAERYDRDVDDIFALQDEISQAIVRALKLKLLPEEKKAIEKRGTSSAEAYDLYLRARQYREAGNADRVLQEAIVRFCERAVAIDPNYAQAWTLLGATQGTLFHILGQAGDAGEAATERALALDPDLGEAHALKARELSRTGRRREALAELERALQLDPDSFDVNYRAGAIHFDDRRFAEAARYFERAAALSESDILSAGVMMSALTALGDQEGARGAARMTLERAEKALAHDRSNGLAISQGVLALAALGQGERAREWIARALLIDPDNEPMRYNFACTLSLYLKDTEAALGLLEPLLAGKQTVEYLRIAKSDPDFDPIREDPRFQAKVAEAEARLAAAGPAEGSVTPKSA
jgi:adenylate cyclase